MLTQGPSETFAFSLFWSLSASNAHQIKQSHTDWQGAGWSLRLLKLPFLHQSLCANPFRFIHWQCMYIMYTGDVTVSKLNQCTKIQVKNEKKKSNCIKSQV